MEQQYDNHSPRSPHLLVLFVYLVRDLANRTAVESNAGDRSRDLRRVDDLVVRRANSGLLSGQPWYVQAVAFVGAPTAIACFMVWWLTNSVTARLDVIETQAKAHTAAEAIGTEQSWQLIGILQRVCLNTSKTADDRLACTLVRRIP